MQAFKHLYAKNDDLRFHITSSTYRVQPIREQEEYTDIHVSKVKNLLSFMCIGKNVELPTFFAR